MYINIVDIIFYLLNTIDYYVYKNVKYINDDDGSKIKCLFCLRKDRS